MKDVESVFLICLASVLIAIGFFVYSYNISFITNGYSENIIVTPSGQYHRVWQKTASDKAIKIENEQ